MISMYSSFLLTYIFTFLVLYSLFSQSNRFSSLNALFLEHVVSLVSSNVANVALSTLFVALCFSNVLGNVPSNYTPTQYYSVVLSISVSFWTPILICATLTDFNGFFAHIFPNGAPIWIIILLPIVEFISIMLRPLILVVRLVTNLAAGHILLFIFSYFASLLPASSPFIGILLSVLYTMEFFISILQAYIFTNLLTLYIEDTLTSD